MSTSNLISHTKGQLIDLKKHEERLRQANSLTLPLDETLSLLKQLHEFEFGRFLLANRGLNGYWTAYLILHGPKRENLHPLEHWLLHQSPIAKATRERFVIFQALLQKHLTSNQNLASIPCGLMDDLLTLDFNQSDNISLTGIDLDSESITLAKQNAQTYQYKTSFLIRDAWQLNTPNKFDAITSNGLNVYEPNTDRVIALYKEFYLALKPGGILITSFLTPPPTLSKESPWKEFSINDLLKQKAILGDIIQGQWMCFRSENETRTQLESAGFNDISFHYDTQHMFPTVLAKKGN